MRQLEPFTELLNSGTDWHYKKMRLMARTPLPRRNYGPDWEASDRHLDAFGDTVNAIVRRIEAEGYSGTFILPDAQLRAIRADLDGVPFVNRHDRSDQRLFDLDRLDADGTGTGTIYSNFEMHSRSPALQALIASAIEPLARAYLGACCKFLNSQVWITFPGTATARNKDFGWHYDVDDFKFLKLFCYLNDVDAATGPHAILPASHRSRHMYRFFNRQLDDRSARQFGEPCVITGPAGSCFFEDTIIYHKGTAPTERPRIILQVQFGVAM